MADLAALPHRLDPEARTCLSVIECPRGKRMKYTYSAVLGGFELKRMLPAGLSFPLDFGFIPSTKAEDGDPLDIMVVNDEPIAMGVIAPVRLIGVIEAEQTESGSTRRNDRIVGVSTSSFQFAAASAFDDLAGDFVETLTQFWTHYDQLRGVEFKVVGISGADVACRRVRTLTSPP